ncbi:hypothetical protein FH972_023954 [Carpinus fangiana]|uniref:Protein phosphatase n=1 Tax=Carpinus fangiana TaxID=176857 RepID=A0A5N6KWN4_9ROSI|nr:hypothetical protein FH972_023954 [Carpinus fangiana]
MGNVGTADAVAFAVADGVGGWSDKGIDSAAFAHGLCDHMSDVASEFVNDGQTQLEPVILLQTAYNRVCHDNKIGGGGSTACVAVAEPDGVLNVANLGDSGFLQLRLNAVHDWSEPQTHAFNTPYQLSQVPPAVLKQIERYGGRHPYQDMPANSDVTSHELLHGDVLVFASDGVWDNLSFEDVLVAVAALMKERGAWTTSNRGGVDVSKGLVGLTDETEPGAQPALQTEIAQSLVTKAKAASLDTKRNGPFAKEVRKAFPREYWAGGKPDDICVVVAIVLEQGS